MDPVVLFFLLGLLAGLAKAEIRMPSAIYEFLSALLLITIGLKGGVELAKQDVWQILPQVLAVILMGISLPLIAFPVLRWAGRFTRADSASIAAHYGSVSVATYAVAVAYLARENIAFEEYMAVFMVVLEMPAIVVGVLLAKGISRRTEWRALSHEVFLGKSIVLLVGGLLIGWISGPEGMVPLQPFFFDLFKGVLALFLLEMGLIASSQVGSLRRYGVFLISFGIAMPLFSSVIGAVLGAWLGLSLGGIVMLATLAASASYIAVPAAVRISIPEANPTLSLSASLGVTFPFNVIIGIALYHKMAVWLVQQGVGS